MSPIFFHKTEKWALGAGFRYELSKLDISNRSLLNESSLNSIDLPIFAALDQSENLQWIFLFNPSLSGDFDHVSGDAMKYMTMVGGRYKVSETFQWIFGAFYSTGLGDDLFVPAIGFTWNPSKETSFMFAGPIIRYKYQFTDSFTLMLGGQFAGNRWNTQSTKYTGSKQERNLRLRSYRVSASLQWNLDKNHVLFATGGIDFARNAEIELINETKILDQDVKSTPSYELGYMYRF
jgi:opacity protein-like surface antigen